jgi:hypothetical protein
MPHLQKEKPELFHVGDRRRMRRRFPKNPKPGEKSIPANVDITITGVTRDGGLQTGEEIVLYLVSFGGDEFRIPQGKMKTETRDVAP